MRWIVGVLTLAVALPASAQIHVATNGADTSSCGAVATPCRTVAQGIARASAGMTIEVHGGTYAEDWLQMKSGTILHSADGALAAKIASGNFSAVRFENVTNAVLDGFEVYGNWNQGPDGDGLVRVLDSTDITVRNCLLHDAPADCDVVKVSGTVSGLLLENLVVYNPAERSSGNPCGAGPWYQENIDIYGNGVTISDVVVRGCWLFHTAAQGGDWLLYTKINAENVLYENNIFGPSAGGGCGNPAVGVGTGEAGEPDPNAYVVQHAIVRNNVFVGLKGDAPLAVMNANDTWIYSNTFWGNSGSLTRSVIEFRGNTHTVGGVIVRGNLFAENHPAASGATFYWVREGGVPSPFTHDENLYFDNIATSDTPYTSEPGSVYGLDPLLAAPAVPSTALPSLSRFAEIAADFALDELSPGREQGSDAVALAGHPNWSPGTTDRRWDLTSGSRPAADCWDLGADQVLPVCSTDLIFADGFESGDLSAWSAAQP